MRTFSSPTVRHPRCAAFALVTTLLILSLLAIVAVSYLSSMAAERQTAEAYGSKAAAEQAAQTGVDNATAMLAQTFRDFPDSATVWDTTQTANASNGATYNSAVVVGGANNEGTSLYLRAVPSGSGASAYAVALPPKVSYATNSGTSYAASNDPEGNDPNNPACQNFVLPLISGVPSGQARLVSQKDNIFTDKMNLNVSDPTKQNWTDLNIRRSSGDVQGVIGSPPSWAGVGPKPARAYWVSLKGSDGVITGRYAFWIEDESFRLNTSLAGPSVAAVTSNPAATPPPQPPDNSAQPTPFPSPAATPSLAGTSAWRSLQPSDLMLPGTLTGAGDTSNASSDAGTIMATRANYPGYFFPDPMAFSHAYSGTSQTALIDKVRYLTTNQSGALNLTRHGSQRLNLNSTISTTADTATIQRQVDQLVQTLEFHLPYFGERFYRKSTANDTATLNAISNQVPGSPKTPSGTVATDDAQIYYYKVAANLRDYIDGDTQPTIVGIGGKVGTPIEGGSVTVPAAQPTGPLEDPQATASSNNEFWAQGKESSPLIQEAAVRYRPIAVTVKDRAKTGYPKGHFDLRVDYYVEFWNMTDQDIYAAPQSSGTAKNLGNATMWIRYQQSWKSYTSTSILQADGSTKGETLQDNSIPHDWQIDLTNNVVNGSTGAQDGTGNKPLGVVFKAGAVTVITTDPDYASYTYKELSGTANNPAANVANMANVFYCQLVPNNTPATSTLGQRQYTGMIYNPIYKDADNQAGLALGNEFGTGNGTTFSDTEISLVNSRGYLDVVRGAITKVNTTGSVVYTNTDLYAGPASGSTPTSYTTQQGTVNDFSYGSSLMGNITDGYAAQPSEMGDPRTNNEQLTVYINSPGADGTHFVPSKRTLGSPNYTTIQPSITTSANQGWGDYYPLPTGTNYDNCNATNAPTVNSDAPLTSIGQLGDVFDPMRLPGSAGTSYSRGGGRTFKIGQHDDRYSNDPSGNATNNSYDGVPASNGWASWRMADVFDVADPVELPGRININGVQRDNGAVLLALLQGFTFQPLTTGDPVVHGDGISGLNGQDLNSNGFAQLVSQMKARLTNASPANGPNGPFFERGELGELSNGTFWLFGANPTASSTSNKSLVSTVDMNTTMDHSREELFRRIAQMICTRGDTFTVYAVGQSILQPPGTTAATADTATKKITGTQRMRVTFRLAPQTWDATNKKYKDFHPAYAAATDGSTRVGQINNFNPASQTVDASAVNARFAKPDRYDVQVLQITAY